MSVIGYESSPVSLAFHPVESTGADVCPYNGYAVLGGSAADVLGVFYAPYKCKVRQAGLVVTETFACATTAPVFHFDKDTAGTAPTSNGDVAIITVPTATAAGKTMYDNYPMTTEITFSPGEWIIVEMHTDAAHTGTVAGKVYPYLLVDFLPETPANISSMVETA
jgi:hypothetical protein